MSFRQLPLAFEMAFDGEDGVLLRFVPEQTGNLLVSVIKAQTFSLGRPIPEEVLHTERFANLLTDAETENMAAIHRGDIRGKPAERCIYGAFWRLTIATRKCEWFSTHLPKTWSWYMARLEAVQGG